MRIFALLLAVIVIAEALFFFTESFRVYEVGIWFAGTHYESGTGTFTPLYSLSIGDPMRYEDELAQNNRTGLSSRGAFQGSVYVRYPQNRELWFRRTCRRPKTKKEIERWHYERVKALPSSFCRDSKPARPQRVLPKPCNALGGAELSLVEYVVGYDRNAIRLYFKALVTRAQVAAFTDALSVRYAVRVEDRTGERR